MSKYQELSEKIKAAHEWHCGQAHSWEGCGVAGTDVCRVCGLQRNWAHGGQNSGDLPDTYDDMHGNPLSLKEAAALDPCCE